MIEQKPKRLPSAVLVSTATWIHLLMVSALSDSDVHVSTETATSSFVHSVLEILKINFKKILRFTETSMLVSHLFTFH